MIKCLACCCVVFTIVSVTAVARETIVVATTEYTPYTTLHGQYGGFVNRVIKEAYKRSGVTVEFKYMPWKEAIELGDHGKVSGVSFSFLNEKRKERYYFSEPISSHKELFFHSKSTQIPDWNVYQDFKSLKIGATRGYTYSPKFWAAQKQGVVDISLEDSDELNFRRLARGYIDLFPMDEISGWILLRTKFPTIKDTLTTHYKPIKKTKGYLIVPKKSKQPVHRVNQFNAGMKAMMKDGTYGVYYDQLLSGKY